VLVAAAVLYLGGVRSLRRRGHHWPARLTSMYFVLGLGSYAVISFGFLGAESHELRWAFTTRIALLLFVVPGLVSLGRPGPGQPAWAALMANKRRKTLIVCADCHDHIHANPVTNTA